MQLICFYFVLLFLAATANEIGKWCTVTKVRDQHVSVECNNTIPKLGTLSLKIIDLLRVNNLQHNIDKSTFEGVNINRLEIKARVQVQISEDAFSSLRHLKELTLTSLELSALPPSIFSNLNNLRVLNLPGNKLERLPDGLFDKLTHLHFLDLSNNRISKIYENTFKALDDLRFLNLLGNYKIEIERNAFVHIKNLQITIDKKYCSHLANPDICTRQKQKLYSSRRQEYNNYRDGQPEQNQITIQQNEDSYLTTEMEKGSEAVQWSFATEASVHQPINMTVDTSMSTGWVINWITDTDEQSEWKVCWHPKTALTEVKCDVTTNTSYTLPSETSTSKQVYRICITSDLNAVCNNTNENDCYCVIKEYDSSSNSNSLIIGLAIGLSLLILLAIVFVILACMLRSKRPSKTNYNVEMADNQSRQQNCSQQVQEIR